MYRAIYKLREDNDGDLVAIVNMGDEEYGTKIWMRITTLLGFEGIWRTWWTDEAETPLFAPVYHKDMSQGE